MPSISYKVTEQLFAHTLKAIMGGTKQEFIDYVYSMAAKRGLEVPSEKWQKRYDYSELEDGEMTVIKLGPRDKPAKGLVLYFTGDGLYMPPSAADFGLCGDIVDNTGLSVWLVSYPLIPDAKPQEMMDSSFAVYKKALEQFAPEKIAVMGISSGCAIGMGLCFYIRENSLDTPFPGRMILQSPPLYSPPTEEQTARMKQIEPKDVTVTKEYFQYLAALTSFMGYEYLIRPLKFDMSSFPPIDIFYGTNEMAYAFLDDFTQKCSSDNVELNAHIGQDMMRSWCLLAKTPEAKSVRQEYYDILVAMISFV